MLRSWLKAVCTGAAPLMLVGASACTVPVDGEVGSHDSSHTELPVMAPSYALSIDSTVVTVHNEDGTESTLHTRMFALAQASQTGPEVVFTLRPCRLLLPPAGNFQGTVEDATIQLATPAVAKASLVAGDDGYELLSDPFQVVLGVEDVAPDEALPTDGDDERVIDVDDDDAPGFSIHFSMMRVFSAIRSTAALTGRTIEDGMIVGPTELDVEHVIYGDSNWLVDAKELAEEAADSTTVDSEDHRFLLTPLDAGQDATCADVLALF